jgi:DNA-binding transcriptional MerR regulator
MSDNSDSRPPGTKHYLLIGEVAQQLNVKPHVLRYWETEFPWLCPEKNLKGQRYYSQDDVELVRFIQRLLHFERLTIEGARKLLEQFKGRWKEGLAAIEAGLPTVVASPDSETQSIQRQSEELLRKLQLLERQAERKDQEIRDLKNRQQVLNRELVQERQAHAELRSLLRKELSDLLRTADEDAPHRSGPALA